MQNQQRWADSTCRLYDNLFWKYVAKIFESIDFTTLTEKEAENIWLEKINVFAGNEEADQRSRRLFEVLVECAHVKGLTTLTFKNFYKDDGQLGCHLFYLYILGSVCVHFELVISKSTRQIR